MSKGFARVDMSGRLTLIKELYFSPNHPTVKELDQAEAFGSFVMKNYLNNNVVKPDGKQKPKAIYRFERFTTNQWLTKNILSKVFKVNHNQKAS